MFSDLRRFAHQVTDGVASPKMTSKRITSMIRRIGTNIEGHPGYWEFSLHGQSLICVVDEDHDRMRLMARVGDVSDLSSDQLREILEANFDLSLDARYCTCDEIVWAVFLHPLRTLAPGLFASACHQTIRLVESFGTSYSSSQIRCRN